MADKSSIEWTEATWNPVVGCTYVSPGCDNCYAAREASGRLKHLPLYAGLAEGGKFTGEVRLVPERLEQPLRWRRPRRVFVNSMSDLFHDGVPDEYIARVFSVMYQAPAHTFQVLTKRHARMRAWVNRCAEWSGYITHNGHPPAGFDGDGIIVGVAEKWPLRNVWLGISVEDQKWADIRIPALLETPATVRWLSCEPLLGPVDLGQVAPGLRYANAGFKALAGDPRIDWVVAGGESGPSARPMHPAWARSLRDQCTNAGVPFFFKQWGEWAPNGFLGIGRFVGRERLVGPRLDDMGHREVIERVGKKAAGRELDARTHDEYPAVTHAHS